MMINFKCVEFTVNQFQLNEFSESTIKKKNLACILVYEKH